MNIDRNDQAWIPTATVGYDDWLECLGVFLLQTAEEPELSFEDWAIIYGSLRTVGCNYSVAKNSTDPRIRSKLPRLLARGIISQQELVNRPMLLASMLRDIWDAAASHRVAGDWLGQIATAAVLAGVAGRNTATMLLLHYRWLFRSGEVEGLWRLNPDDPGEEVNAQTRLEEAILLRDSIGPAKSDNDEDWPPEHHREGNRLVSFERLSFQGTELHGDELVEAAHFMRLSGGWPAIVAATSPWMPRLLLAPIFIADTRIEMFDLTAGQRIVLRRLDNTTTGWLTTDY